MERAAQRILVKLRLHGHEAFFAGGWVRDFLLRSKAKDIDIATSALPEEVLRIFPRAILIGAKFGVVQTRMYGHPYDIATFRSEGPYLDGRHPSSVSFTGPKQDALRRDFTINGLFYDPVADRVIDYVHGASDIRKRVIRTIGKPQDRFREDKLRMLRAVRFSCSLNFKIAAETWEAIREFAPAILEVSWERIRDELIKILTGPAPGHGLDLLYDCGLLSHILPEVTAMRGIPQPPEFHPEGDVFVHTRNVLDLLKNPSPALALAALLHDAGKPPTFEVKDRIRFHGHAEISARIAEEVCRRLRMSNEEVSLIIELVRDHLSFMNIHRMRVSTLKRFLSRKNIEDHLELHRADCLGSNGSLESYRFALGKYQELKREPPLTAPVISGHDLIHIGFTPGPVFAEILRAIEDLQLENPGLTREEALLYVRTHFSLGKPED